MREREARPCPSSLRGWSVACDSCHTKQNAGAALPRKKEHELLQCGGEPDSCPLKIKHPPNGR